MKREYEVHRQDILENNQKKWSIYLTFRKKDYEKIKHILNNNMIAIVHDHNT